MRVEVYQKLPDNLVKVLRDEYVPAFHTWQEPLKNMLREVHVIFDDDKPVLALGSVQTNLLDNYCQIWCVLTRHFSLDKLVFARDYLLNYWKTYTGLTVYAFTRTRKDAKFACWFGGKLEKTENGLATYRMSP